MTEERDSPKWADFAVEQRAIDALIPYSRQAEFFGDLPEPQFVALVEDMRIAGQRVPIEILPDGTVLCGHQRLRAARRLRWPTLRVVVRHDLADRRATAAHARFLEDNLHRRQLSELEISQVVNELAEIAWVDQGRRGEKRRFVTKFLAAHGIRVSAKTMERRGKILTLPNSIREAVSRKQLSQRAALYVADLPPAEIARLALRIDEGTLPSDAVEEYRSLNETVEKSDPCRDSYRELIEFCETQLQPLMKAKRRLIGTVGHDRAANALAMLRKFVDDVAEKEAVAREEKIRRLEESTRN